MATADIQTVQRALSVLFREGDTVELRCLTGDRVINGYYRNLGKLAADACALNTDFSPQQNVFVILNPVDPLLYGRRADQYGPAKKGEGTKDQDVSCLRWLLIDCDPQRPPGVSATDAQHKAAGKLAKAVLQYLQELHLPSPVCCDSGNGAHLLLPLADLPNSAPAAWACEQFIKHLAERFPGKRCKVDHTTFNPARICALPGCVKRKGSSTAEQPHRLTRLLFVPDPIVGATLQQLLAVVGPYPGDQHQAAPSAAQQAGSTGWNIPQLLAERRIEHTVDDQYITKSGERATRYTFDTCPFDPQHDDRSACLIQWQTGAVAFRCHHDGCIGKDWAALKVRWNLPAAGGLTAADIVLPAAQPIAAPAPIALDLPSYVAPPAAPDGVFYGPLGKLVQTYAPHTEASPISMLACLLTYYGNALGRRYYSELDGRQFPKLFCCLIGKTARGRKFTADQNACRMMDAIYPLAELFRHTGLSTGEGLIKTLLDHKDGMLLHPAVFQEGEFASVIKRKERRGNSLDDVLRNAWDDTALGTTTRADPLRAVGSHVSLVVHVTPDELKRLLSACDLTSGFANRFLWVHSQRSQRKPGARGFTPAMVGRQIDQLQQAFQQLTDRPALEDSQEIPLTPEAASCWETLYRELDGEDSDDDAGLLQDLCARLPAYLRRVALIYCLADGRNEITPAHLQAAWALVQYSRETLDYVYSLVSWADPNSAQELTRQRAARFLRSVAAGQEIPRWQVSHRIYQRNRTARELNEIREYLLRSNQLQVREENGQEIWHRLG